MRLGLTGGVACGKSTVARSLEARGWGRVDCDLLAGEILARDSSVREQLEERWNESLRLPGGGIDRARIARIVFAQADELAFLENLLHPLVAQRWKEIVAADCKRSWVVEVPLLFEVGWAGDFDQTAVVAASEMVWRKRLAARPGSIASWEQRVRRQWALEKKMAHAETVFWNNGTPAFCELQIEYWCQSCFS